MPASVLCKDCAKFVVIHAETGERVEANRELRQTGKHIFINAAGVRKQYVPIPVCHAGKRWDWRDFPPTDEPQTILNTIRTPVPCDAFELYEPGRGPRELDEMDARKTATDLQEKLLSLQQNVFAWRQQQAERDDKFEMQIQALGQVHHNENVGMTRWQSISGVAAVVVAVLSLIVSIVALFVAA